MKNLKEFYETNADNLELYSKAIARVHGQKHPELADVRNIVISVQSEMKNNGSEAKLDDQFEKLRNITNNYDVPADGCETYQATYRMLEELDELYHTA